MCWLYKSRYREAIEELETAVALSEERPLFLAVLGNALARSGRSREARRILARLRELSEAQPVSPTAFAILYLGLGDTDRWFDSVDTDRWFDSVEEAIERRDGMIVFGGVDPLSDSVRSHPRFETCLRRLGLS